MKFSINQSILDRFGNVSIGVAMFELSAFSEKLEAYCSQTQSEMKERFSKAGLENIEHVKKWADIFRAMNAGKDYESSVIFLTKHLMKKGSLFHIHPVVDLYNTVSIKFGLPMGAYDAVKLIGHVELRQAKKGEKFIGIMRKNAKEENVEETDADEVVYSDETGVFCRYWNDRDCERTKITDDTRQFVFIFDGIDDREKIQNAISELKEILADAKDFKYVILDKQNPQQELGVI